MEGKSLEQVITENGDGDGDILAALDKYFETSFMPPRSELTKDAINILLTKVRQRPELFVPWVVKCFDDFNSNEEIERVWLDYCKELSQLWRACLDDDETYEVHSRDICRIFISLGEKGEPLSSTLFNTCASKFLELIDSSNVQTGLSSLTVLTTLCRFSEHSKIARTFELWAYQLNKLAERAISLPVEAQINVYMILIKSICSKEDAVAKASLWFDQWPKIQRTILDYYPDKIAEGCGEFLQELMCLSEATRNPTIPITEPGLDCAQLEPVTRHKKTDEPITGSLCDVPILSENSGKEKRLKDSAFDRTFDTSYHFTEQPKRVGKEHSKERLYADPVAHSTGVEESIADPVAHSTGIEKSIDFLSDVTDDPDNISKLSKNEAAPRFTLRNNLSFLHLPKPTTQIGDDLALPVEPRKHQRCFNYINGNWCFRFKKYSEVSSKERWPSFKWNSSRK
ncbi:uncharacterized protein LOC117639017 [Thrips palmi]|uniref:Uncharacterized protein LOC117639017 n=1 Tax=Thrips palmi TaxID=161013 RepID=A0A6P8Y2G7_THRPL|nr:uncharacterized protein LOC117639017 [Thrips palmi]